MKKFTVEYKSGESRYSNNTVVDYMLAKVGDIELYAEMENPTWNEEKGAFDDETCTYDELKASILEQAMKCGIDTKQLQFYYD